MKLSLLIKKDIDNSYDYSRLHYDIQNIMMQNACIIRDSIS